MRFLKLVVLSVLMLSVSSTTLGIFISLNCVVGSMTIVAPYVSLVLNIFPLEGMLGDIVGIFGIQKNHETVLIILGLFLFITFLLKAIAVIFINWSISLFNLDRKHNAIFAPLIALLY